MPLTVAKMATKENETSFEYGGEDVNVTYRSGIITNEWEAKYKNKPDGIFGQVHDLVVKWDVLDDKGEALATDLDTLKTLPIEFLAHLVKSCADDLVPNRKTSRRSGRSSFGE